MARRKPADAFQRVWSQVSNSGVGDLVQRFRPVSRPDFLADLLARGTQEVLADKRGVKTAWQHLALGWQETVTAVAAPSTLPEVVERRNRQRVNPLAPWTTSATAGLGSVAVVAGDNEAWVEVLGVAGVIGIVGLVAAVLWRPRVRRVDRRFRVSGAAALTARADVLAGEVAHASLDPAMLQETDRVLVEITGGARALEELESEARRIGLLHADGSVLREPGIPAEQQVTTELLHVRGELLHDVLHLQALAQQLASRSRWEDRATYREVNGDLGGSAPEDLS